MRTPRVSCIGVAYLETVMRFKKLTLISCRFARFSEDSYKLGMLENNPTTEKLSDGWVSVLALSPDSDLAMLQPVRASERQQHGFAR